LRRMEEDGCALATPFGSAAKVSVWSTPLDQRVWVAKREGIAIMIRSFAWLLASAMVFFAIGSAHVRAQDVAAQAAFDATAWQQDLAAWRSQREIEISAPDGWLTLAGLEWLKPGINSVGSAADNTIRLASGAPEHLGLLTVMGGSNAEKQAKAASTSGVVQLLAPSAGFPDGMQLDGKKAREGELATEGAKPSTISWRGLSLVVLKRGDRFVLRIKNADSPVRTGFRGLHWYAPDPRYRITARWVPFKPALVEEIPTVLGTTLKLPAPGLAIFLVDGKIEQLEPVLEDPSSKTLFFILRDETSKTATYGGGRFLHTGFPDHGLDEPGSLTLDFNRLENPPCAYTIYATCPLPPKQNQLDIAIEAGEQRYVR